MKAGGMRKLELHLGRKLVWLVATYGELPLHRLIVELVLLCQTTNYLDQ